MPRPSHGRGELVHRGDGVGVGAGVLVGVGDGPGVGVGVCLVQICASSGHSPIIASSVTFTACAGHDTRSVASMTTNRTTTSTTLKRAYGTQVQPIS